MTFTASQINDLRNRFSKIHSVDPCGDAYDGMCKLLNSLDLEDLSALAGANIKFLSKFATNRIIRRAVA